MSLPINAVNIHGPLAKVLHDHLPKVVTLDWLADRYLAKAVTLDCLLDGCSAKAILDVSGAPAAPRPREAAAGRDCPCQQEAAVLKVPDASAPLAFVPGAFLYRGRRFALTATPLAILRALAGAPERTCTERDLKAGIWGDYAIEPATVRSHVRTARKALRLALKAAGLNGPDDPIPVVARGDDLAWRLDLP
jgi:DNA-binding response OmpR family regulator